ncbi:hypothetical protein HZC34_06765 [Candidatus Saganbacteria bacterium]|nr:hypothetical protein [Candidatus Saganbacteria bacterium]
MNYFRSLSLTIGVLFVICYLSFVISAPADAYFPFPSLTGSSGLTRIPDANSLPYKNWNMSIDYGVSKSPDQPSMYYKANIGAFHNFELGMVGGLDAAGKEIRDGVYVNLKYSPAIGDGSDPLLLAIGIDNLASKTMTDVYMVATKPFSQGPSLSFGFMADFPQNKFRPMGMAGIDVPFGTMSVLADMFAGETVFQLNGGLRVRLLPTFAVDVRAINIAGNQQNALATKDAQQYLLGMSWINPF